MTALQHPHSPSARRWPGIIRAPCARARLRPIRRLASLPWRIPAALPVACTHAFPVLHIPRSTCRRCCVRACAIAGRPAHGLGLARRDPVARWGQRRLAITDRAGALQQVATLPFSRPWPCLRSGLASAFWICGPAALLPPCVRRGHLNRRALCAKLPLRTIIPLCALVPWRSRGPLHVTRPSPGPEPLHRCLKRRAASGRLPWHRRLESRAASGRLPSRACAARVRSHCQRLDNCHGYPAPAAKPSPCMLMCSLQCRVFLLHRRSTSTGCSTLKLLTLAEKHDQAVLCSCEGNSPECYLQVADLGMQAQEARLKMGPSSGSELLVPVISA